MRGGGQTRRARAYNGGMGSWPSAPQWNPEAEPMSGINGAMPPETKNLSAVRCSCRKFASFSVFCKQASQAPNETDLQPPLLPPLKTHRICINPVNSFLQKWGTCPPQSTRNDAVNTERNTNMTHRTFSSEEDVDHVTHTTLCPFPR